MDRVGVGLERRGEVTVRILEPLKWVVGEGVGHGGRAESWVSSGKGEMTHPCPFQGSVAQCFRYDCVIYCLCDWMLFLAFLPQFPYL